MQFAPKEALTFDDVLLAPGYSEILPIDVDLTSSLLKGITLKVPFLSAAMDTVTESATAIAMAQEGGMGVIHRSLGIEAQAREVEKVKKYESGLIQNPVTTTPDKSIGELIQMMEQHRISGFPVLENGKLVGIVTSRDLRYTRSSELKVRDVMTRTLVTAPEGISMQEAKELLHAKRIEKLPVVDKQGHLKGLLTSKDIDKSKQHPFATKDAQGRLLVAAAVGVNDDDRQRVAALVEKNVDLIVIDLAHGHSKRMVEFLKWTKKQYRDLQIMAGNVATPEGVKMLAEAGADIVKIGIGAGSICTTRIIGGAGMPQLTAVHECGVEARKLKVPIIADGGIKFSGDIVKAMAAGADAVMIGSLFAGTNESPGENVLFQGRTYKTYRGMGSIGALKESTSSRYFPPAGASNAPVPEGVEGRVPHRGSLAANLHQLSGGLRTGMAYIGARNLKELREKARFIKISNASLRESHVHDVIITQEAPNYRPTID